MLLMGDVVEKRYQIVSRPFENRNDAYEEIKEYWKGVNGVTTYYRNGKWYIVLPV